MTKAKAVNGGDAKRRGLSRQEFAEQNDYATKCRLAIRRVVKSLNRDEILKDADFRTECGVSLHSSWRSIAEAPEFHKYQFKFDDRYWWACPETVKWALENVAKARGLE